MKIQSPTLGPIIGYTTSNQVRIWLRGDLQKTEDGYRRCFGVAQIKEAQQDFGPPKYVKLPPYFDMTGVCAFTGLKPETEYEYRVGWFFAETSLPNLDATQDLDWSKSMSGSFRTAAANAAVARTYAVGSCRYLLRLFGGEFFDERGDKVFLSILNQIKEKTQIDGLVMVGDQIYADDLNVIGADSDLDQYLERYRAVFGQPYLRRLMASVPTYMILDDHEIEDNWPEHASDKDWLTKYPAAIHAYQIYQCSHSPLFELDSDERIDGTLDHFWYSFTDGCCDWFFTDSRTERVWDENPSRRKMMKKKQMDSLLNWLGDNSGRVKMVVTSVPFFPDLESESEDKWGGYLAERSQILDYIYQKQIRKVVFVSGDVHCSFSAELLHPQDPQFKVISVVSSSFFWPYPHMDEGDFKLAGKLKVPREGNTYQVRNASEVYGTDNFARLTIDSQSIAISFFERKGKQLGKTVIRQF